MRKATLEKEWTGKTFDLTDLLNRKNEVVIGKRNPYSDTQVDIFLGEEDGEPDDAAPFMQSISKRQAVITYGSDGFYIEDCSEYGTTNINKESLRKGEKRLLKNGVSLYFGIIEYGPFIFHEEI